MTNTVLRDKQKHKREVLLYCVNKLYILLDVLFFKIKACSQLEHLEDHFHIYSTGWNRMTHALTHASRTCDAIAIRPFELAQ